MDFLVFNLIIQSALVLNLKKVLTSDEIPRIIDSVVERYQRRKSK